MVTESQNQNQGHEAKEKEKPSGAAHDHEGIFPSYYERRLVIDTTQFLIAPNGGGGDCLFKAIAQAISEEDDETQHMAIRGRIVDYIVHHLWEKLKDSIEIQHIYGNTDLVDEWATDPKKTYTDYMAQSGTLGSFIELMAAAELLQFNFASIQEYAKDVKTYRVENFSGQSFENRPVFHFLFTGDYESGHWEHLIPLLQIRHPNTLADGTYSGSLYIIIDGVQTSLDDWMNEMEEKNRRSDNSGGKNRQSDTGSEPSDSYDESNTANETSASGSIHEYNHGISGRSGSTQHPPNPSYTSTNTHKNHRQQQEEYESFIGVRTNTVGTDHENNVATEEKIDMAVTTTDNETDLSETSEAEELKSKSNFREFFVGNKSKTSNFFQTETPDMEEESEFLLFRQNRPEKNSKLFSYKSNAETTDTTDKKKGCCIIT